MLKEIFLFCVLTFVGSYAAGLAKRARQIAEARAAIRPKRMGLVERWRDEERRMAEAEAAKLAETEEPDDDLLPEDGEEIEDDPAILFCDDEEPEDTDEAFCALCGAAADSGDAEEEAFCEKELRRLYKVRSGLKLKEERMLYVCQVNDASLSAEARQKRMAKLEATKAWRGLQFDLNYINNEINGLEDYIKRG